MSSSCHERGEGEWDAAQDVAHLLGNRSLSQGDVELEQLAVEARSAPQRIGLAQVPNERNRVWGKGFPAKFSRSRFSPMAASCPLSHSTTPMARILPPG